jgi:arylsulfatase A-like enzyme
MMGGRDIPLMKKERPFLGKVFPYEDSVRVPLMIRMPGGKPAGASDAPVSSLDLPPTILKVAGVAPPRTWPGRDLFDESVKPAEAFCEFADNQSDKFGDIAYRLVRTATHKLIVFQSHPEELYDVTSDPQESKNLAGDPSAKPVKDDLHKRLEDWMRKTNDPALSWKRPN